MGSVPCPIRCSAASRDGTRAASRRVCSRRKASATSMTGDSPSGLAATDSTDRSFDSMEASLPATTPSTGTSASGMARRRATSARNAFDSSTSGSRPLRTRNHTSSELLWSDEAAVAPTATRWPRTTAEDEQALSPVLDVRASPIGRIAIAAHVLAGLHPQDDSIEAARRLLSCMPTLFGSTRRTGSFAQRLTSAWRRRPDPAVVDAVDTALALLADHELSTSTIAVRIAA